MGSYATTPSREDLIEALYDCVTQACSQGDELDSMALGAYADALRILGTLGMVVIVHDVGRRVIARYPDPKVIKAPKVGGPT